MSVRRPIRFPGLYAIAGFICVVDSVRRRKSTPNCHQDVGSCRSSSSPEHAPIRRRALLSVGLVTNVSKMELRQIKYFIAVAEEQHFTRAAERVGIEQSPLSRAIRSLEREIGVVLLERSTRRSKVTPAGREFLRHARSIVNSIEFAKRSAQAVARFQPYCGCVMGLEKSAETSALTESRDLDR